MVVEAILVEGVNTSVVVVMEAKEMLKWWVIYR